MPDLTSHNELAVNGVQWGGLTWGCETCQHKYPVFMLLSKSRIPNGDICHRGTAQSEGAGQCLQCRLSICAVCMSEDTHHK